MLAYRRNAFESEPAKKAAKDAGINLASPTSWEDLDALAKFFQGRDWTGDGKPDFGLVTALGDDPEGIGEDVFLARSASLGQHPDHYSLLFDPDTMDPAIASPPFVQALQSIVAWKKCGPSGCETLSGESARKAFREGNVAFLIDLAERANHWTDTKHPASVAIAALPGSPRVYDPDRKSWQNVPALNRVTCLPRGGGWLAGISRNLPEAKRKAAVDFLRAIAGPDASRALISDAAFPLLPIRGALLGGGLPNPRDALGVDSRGWGIAVSQALSAPRVLPGLRIPGAERYLAALKHARIDALGGRPVEESLQDAAKTWSQISKELGEKRQLWHYRRSLNELITTPDPPSKTAG